MAGKANLRKEKFSVSRDKNGVIKRRGPIIKGDARLKIIQKNRSKLVDARDRLAQMAKTTDARAKLLKLRQMRTVGGPSNGESVRPVGASILLKKDRNGKISLSTNKSKSSPVSTDMNTAIRKELGLIRNQRKIPIAPKAQPVRQIRRTIGTLSPQAQIYRSPAHSLNISSVGYPSDVQMVDAFTPPLIKRTIRNDIIREMPPLPDFSQPRISEQNAYSWIRPINRQQLPSQSSLEGLRQSVQVTARNNLLIEPDNEWSYADPSVRSIKMSSMFIDDEEIEEMNSRSTSARMKTGVHARLDTPPSNNHSQGIFAHTKTKVVVPVGHRIVVSNLQTSVTQDDIRELFEDIGELLVSRLVRPGTAEVIYKNLKDAQKAVDTYHNRQLDGQPMKCLLVNKRPVNNPTAPALKPTKTPSVLRTSTGLTKAALNSKTQAKLVPDISTIHKVLFRK